MTPGLPTRPQVFGRGDVEPVEKDPLAAGHLLLNRTQRLHKPSTHSCSVQSRPAGCVLTQAGPPCLACPAMQTRSRFSMGG